MEIVVHGRTGFTRLIVCELFDFRNKIGGPVSLTGCSLTMAAGPGWPDWRRAGFATAIGGWSFGSSTVGMLLLLEVIGRGVKLIHQ
jgi:hypothetical protein